jgi:phosphohistidine phosphatase
MPDYDRSLTGQGLIQCAAVKARLGPTAIDAALCSPAKRTRETLRHVLQNLPIEIDTAESFYRASAGTWLNSIAATDESVRSLLVIGHNPSISELAGLLANGDSPVPGTLSPATLVVFSYDGEWSEIGPRACRLISTFNPDNRHPR